MTKEHIIIRGRGYNQQPSYGISLSRDTLKLLNLTIDNARDYDLEFIKENNQIIIKKRKKH